jgi:hypothetical protein
VGGLVGAAVATAHEAGPTAATTTHARTRGASRYWISFGGTLGVWAALAVLVGLLDGHVGGAVGWALGGLLLGLPFLQIVASVVAALACLGERDPAERALALRRVFRITGGAMGGAALGTFVMVLIFVLFAAGSK